MRRPLPISMALARSGIVHPTPSPLGNLKAIGPSSYATAVATIWQSSASSAAAITTKPGKFAKNPIVEESLLTGKLEKTNQCYAIAKIAGIKLCEALYEDSKLDIVCLMPTNIYGINDNFDKLNGHVIPAMISKFVEAKEKKRKIVK